MGRVKLLAVGGLSGFTKQMNKASSLWLDMGFQYISLAVSDGKAIKLKGWKALQIQLL